MANSIPEKVARWVVNGQKSCKVWGLDGPDGLFYAAPSALSWRRSQRVLVRNTKAYPAALVFLTEKDASASAGARRCWYVRTTMPEVIEGMGKLTGDGPRVFFGGSASSIEAHWTRASALRAAIVESTADEAKRAASLKKQRAITKALRAELKAERAKKV